MAKDQQETRRKLRILDHAAASGDVSKTCRYFGIGRASFSATRAMSTLTPNWPSGSNSTTSPDHAALTMGKRLTKRSEKSYNDMKRWGGCRSPPTASQCAKLVMSKHKTG